MYSAVTQSRVGVVIVGYNTFVVIVVFSSLFFISYLQCLVSLELSFDG